MERKKLVLEEDVTMTGCLNAVKKLRNCPICPHRFNREECKSQKCVPRVVVDVIEFAIREHFYSLKQSKLKDKKVSKEEVDNNESNVDRLRI